MLNSEFKNLISRLDGQTLDLVATLLADAERQDEMWDGNGRSALQTRIRLNAAKEEVEMRKSAPWADPHPEETALLVEDDDHVPGFPFFD